MLNIGRFEETDVADAADVFALVEETPSVVETVSADVANIYCSHANGRLNASLAGLFQSNFGTLMSS